MSEEKTEQNEGLASGKAFLKKAVIIFSIVEAIVMLVGIIYKLRH